MSRGSSPWRDPPPTRNSEPPIRADTRSPVRSQTGFAVAHQAWAIASVTAPAPTDYELLAGRYDEDRERFSVPHDGVIEALLGSRAAVRVLSGKGATRYQYAVAVRLGSALFVGVTWHQLTGC